MTGFLYDLVWWFGLFWIVTTLIVLLGVAVVWWRDVRHVRRTEREFDDWLRHGLQSRRQVNDWLRWP